MIVGSSVQLFKVNLLVLEILVGQTKVPAVRVNNVQLLQDYAANQSELLEIPRSLSECIPIIIIIVPFLVIINNSFVRCI